MDALITTEQDHAMASLDDVIRSRRSARAFLAREIPEATLRDVFELAQMTPSNCNAQPWIPHVVSGASADALRQKLYTAAQADRHGAPDYPAGSSDYTGIYRARKVDAAKQLYNAMGVTRDDLAGRNIAYLRNFSFFDAPHAVFIFMPSVFNAREVADCGMYAQTLLLAMTSRGIASCAQGALGLHPHIVREHLGLSDHHRLLFGISFGYEDRSAKANAARVGRESIDVAVTFHR